MPGLTLPSLTLYGVALSPFTMRAVMQMAFKRMDLPITPPPGGLHSEEYQRINPIDKIPALATPEGVLPESEIIVEYLEQCFPEPALLPADALPRSQSRLLSRIADLYLMNALMPAFAHLDPTTRDQEAVDAVMDNVRKGLSHVDRYLSASPFALGERPTLADCALLPILKFLSAFMPFFGHTDPMLGDSAAAKYFRGVQGDPVVSRSMRMIEESIAAWRAAQG